MISEKYKSKFLVAIDEAEELLKIKEPTKADATRLASEMPNNFVIKRHFFSGASASWLLPLKKHYFKRPPLRNLVTGEFDIWYETKYLVRVAQDESEEVSEIIKSMPETENYYILEDICSIMLSIPPSLTVDLYTSKLRQSLQNNKVYISPEKIGEIITKLGDAKYVDEALELSELSIEIKPQESSFQHIEVISVYNYHIYDYQILLQNHVLSLALLHPLKIIEILIKTLYQASNLNGEDVTRFW